MSQNFSHRPIGNSPTQWLDRHCEHCSAKSMRVIAHFTFVAAVLLATGCSTAPADGARTTAPSHFSNLAKPPSFQRLIKGMRRAEVAKYLGPAVEVNPFVSEGASGEIWVYKRTYPGPSRQIAAAMRDVPFVDPVTGEMLMIREPDFKNELTTITEIYELLFIKDLLVEWKQKRFTDRYLD